MTLKEALLESKKTGDAFMVEAIADLNKRETNDGDLRTNTKAGV